MTASGGLRVFPVYPLPRPNDTFGSAIRNGCFTSKPDKLIGFDGAGLGGG